MKPDHDQTKHDVKFLYTHTKVKTFKTKEILQSEK